MSVFNLNYIRNFVENYCGPHPDFMMQIFMSQEYNKCESTQEWSRNNWLHWDPYPALKFFIYLTDIGEESAPTHVVPGSRAIGRKYREKMSLSDLGGWKSGCKHRLEDWEERPVYTNKDAQPIYTTSGSLLIFDTDSLHFGGLLNAEKETRKTILVHHRPRNLRMPVYSEKI
jgi:ectoine hydroxylase-related dioxygenase (phytanoyl-CoA dioxygenase family)